MESVRTNIVIITYNALTYTKVTLMSLFEQTVTPYNLTIVDNNSNIETIEYLEQLVPPTLCKKFTLIKNNENAGVGHAYNQGMDVSFQDGIEFTAFCNNDLYFSHNWLGKLENRMIKNRNVAMLSPLRPSAKVSYDKLTSTQDMLMQLKGDGDWLQELAEYTNLPLDQFDKFSDTIINNNGAGKLEIINFPDSLSTCVCLARNVYFKKESRFADPRFTGYGSEDIDTSWSIMEQGYDCAVDHSVYVHHFRGKSLRDNGLDRAQLIKRSNKKLYEKWKHSIERYIKTKQTKGIDVISLIINGRNSEYWLLYALNQDEEFIKEYSNV